MEENNQRQKITKTEAVEPVVLKDAMDDTKIIYDYNSSTLNITFKDRYGVECSFKGIKQH